MLKLFRRVAEVLINSLITCCRCLVLPNRHDRRFLEDDPWSYETGRATTSWMEPLAHTEWIVLDQRRQMVVQCMPAPISFGLTLD
jgi:hypothetical protein